MRPQNTLTPDEKHLLEVHQRMIKEADFAFKQAFAFCPYSPEALYRYVQLLAGARRFDEAIMLAQTSIKVDPKNAGLKNLIGELQRLKTQAGNSAIAPQESAAGLAKAEAAHRANPADFNTAVTLAQSYASMGRTADVLRLADEMIALPNAGKDQVTFAAQVFQQLSDFPRLEKALEHWTKIKPEPESWLDYAAAQAVQGKSKQAITSLVQALALNRERLKTDAKASNVAAGIEADARFASLKGDPDFKQLMATNK
jgi:tetratricopeptide (TPR) repeat protein